MIHYLKSKQLFSQFAFVLLSLIFVFAASVQAERSLTADAVEISTPVYQANFADFDPPLGIYEYRVSWQGIGAGRFFSR